MKKFLLSAFSFLIGIGIFIWVLNFVGWQNIRDSFAVFTGWQGMVILLLTFLIILFGVLEWRIILKGLGVDLSFKDLFEPFIAGFSINYLAPIIVFGQEIFRSYILKKQHSLPWTKGIASSAIDRILDLTAELIFVFFGIISFLFLVGFIPKNLAIYCGGIILFLIIMVSFFYFKIFKKESIIKSFVSPLLSKYQNDKVPLQVEEEVFNFFETEKNYLWQGFFLTFLEKIIKLFRAWILIIFFGQFIGFSPALAILGFSYLIAMIPIPAQLGSQETAQAFIFDSLGLEASRGIAFSMVMKGAELFFVLTGVFIGLNLWKKVRRKTVL